MKITVTNLVCVYLCSVMLGERLNDGFQYLFTNMQTIKKNIILVKQTDKQTCAYTTIIMYPPTNRHDRTVSHTILHKQLHHVTNMFKTEK